MKLSHGPRSMHTLEMHSQHNITLNLKWHSTLENESKAIAFHFNAGNAGNPQNFYRHWAVALAWWATRNWFTRIEWFLFFFFHLFIWLSLTVCRLHIICCVCLFSVSRRLCTIEMLFYLKFCNIFSYCYILQIKRKKKKSLIICIFIQ